MNTFSTYATLPPANDATLLRLPDDSFALFVRTGSHAMFLGRSSPGAGRCFEVRNMYRPIDLGKPVCGPSRQPLIIGAYGGVLTVELHDRGFKCYGLSDGSIEDHPPRRWLN